MCTLTVQTIRELDEIREALGLRSRGDALDVVITDAWRRFEGPSPSQPKATREAEILARIETMGRSRLCNGNGVIRSAMEHFRKEMASMAITRTIHFRTDGSAPVETRNHPKKRILVENGRWTVPAKDRPAGWEFMVPSRDIEASRPSDLSEV